MSNSTDLDIAIVGGGLVGASLACALSELDYRCALIEAVPLKADLQPSYDDRTLALNHTSCQILRGLGLWPEVRSRATAIREILISELGRPGRVHLRSEDHGLDAFGHVVEAREYGAAVASRLPDLPGLDFYCPARVSGISQTDHQVRLTIDENQQQRHLTARLVVAADGARSSVRDMLAIKAAVHDYQQTAVIANVMPEQAHENRAFERFTNTGPLAVLPNVEGRCGVVWTVERGRETTLLDCPDDEFIERLQDRFGYRLGKLSKPGVRSSYPLYLVRSERNVVGRVVIIGNAAHTIHPVSAQGFNLGLRDVAVLAEILAADQVDDPGEQDLLYTFDKLRQDDQQATIRYTDTLARSFSNPSSLISHLRTLGMAAHELLPPLQRKLTLGAMGFRGPAPRLARGQSVRMSHASDG